MSRGKRQSPVIDTLILPLGLSVPKAVSEDELLAHYDWANDLKQTPQDKLWHAEGDVLTHTVMVINELVHDPQFIALSPNRQMELYWASLLHDIAKPETTQLLDGKLRAPNHATRGAVKARRILWEAGVIPASRERICAMILHHMAPMHFINNSFQKTTERVIWTSLGCRADDLLTLCRADTHGRIGVDLAESLEKIELAEIFFKDLNCLESPYAFASDYSRFRYFHDQKPDPAYHAYDDRIGTMWLTHGLPGSGKDYWVKKLFADLPVVSLDEIRKEFNFKATGNQSPVAQKARDKAKEYLRCGQDFIWNATNLSRDLRKPLIQLGDDYKYHVKILQVETPHNRLFLQNNNRDNPVPGQAIEKMLRRWQVPDLREVEAIKIVGH